MARRGKKLIEIFATYSKSDEMEQVSVLLKVAFVFITLLTVFQFYRASHRYRVALLVILGGWMALQLFLGLAGFYIDVSAKPPRFLFLFLPPVILIISLFLLPAGKQFIDQLDRKQLTLLHTIRIAVEVVLYYLYIAKVIPDLMTFEGRNFDIIAGLTAPFIFYFGFVKNSISNGILIVWNLVCLALLANIVSIAILSARTPLQQLAFDQPNIVIAYFPFNWLPGVVVPIVLFSHLATLRQLIMRKN